VASPYDALVHEVHRGWWVVAEKRGEVFVAPIAQVHRAHCGDFAIGPDLRSVAAWAHGSESRAEALSLARDLFPYAGLRDAA